MLSGLVGAIVFGAILDETKLFKQLIKIGFACAGYVFISIFYFSFFLGAIILGSFRNEIINSNYSPSPPPTKK